MFGLVNRRLSVVFAAVCLFPLCLSLSAAEYKGDVSKHPDAFWLATSENLLKISSLTGEFRDEVSVDTADVVATDRRTGDVWVAGDNVISVLNASGELKRRFQLPLKGKARLTDIAIDSSRDQAWFVTTKSAFRTDLTGQVLTKTRVPSRIQATALEPDNGSFWVGTNKVVQRFSETGAVASRTRLSAGGRIAGITVSHDSESTWVAIGSRILGLSPRGAEVASLSNPFGQSTVDIKSSSEGRFFVLGRHRLALVDSSGALMWEAPIFTGGPQSSNAGGRVRIAATDPSDGSIWISNTRQIIHFASNSQIVHTHDLKRLLGPKVKAVSGAVYADVFPPELAITTPSDGAFTNDDKVGITLEWSDIGSGIDFASINIGVNSQEKSFNCDQVEKGALCKPDAAWVDGEKRVTAQVADYAFNSSEPQSVEFTVDTIPPKFLALKPASGLVTNESVVTLQGTINEPATVSIGSETTSLSDDFSFRKNLELEEGANEFRIVAIDRAGNEAEKMWRAELDTIPPAVPDSSLITISLDAEVAVVSGEPGSVEPGAEVTVLNRTTGESVTVKADSNGSFSAEISATPGDALAIKAIDAASNESDSVSISVPGTVGPISDPSETAAPTPNAARPAFYESVAHLFNATAPTQRNTEPDTFDEDRVSVVRGRVTDRTGEPLSGVRVTIHNRPDYGYTETRDDGFFDLAVNGGGLIVVTFQKDGYLSAQRKVSTTWNDWHRVDEVSLVELDDKVTTVDLTKQDAQFQVAQGSVSEDADGQRQATLLFPRGVAARYNRPDGTVVRPDTIDVRATEYTVGDRGHLAMPANLPPASGYTYAVELSVDQARQHGIKENGIDVRFSKPVVFYVDNFLDFPSGEEVPIGYYDGDAAAWKAYRSGRVIEILDIKNGKALLELDGSGTSANVEQLKTLGITDAEREKIAELYEVGESVWRATLSHFSTWDCNWPWGPPLDAIRPNIPLPDKFDSESPNDSKEEDDCKGCSISPQTQSVEEAIPIAGTASNITYDSESVPGYKSGGISIPLTGESLPDSILRVDLTIEIAGQRLKASFEPKSNLYHTFRWNGEDAYGRRVYGDHEAKIEVAYQYPCLYRGSDNGFGEFSGPNVRAIGTRQSCDGIAIARSMTQVVSSPNKMSPAIAQGWSYDHQHSLNPQKGLLHKGNGETVKLPVAGTIETYAGDWDSNPPQEGIPASEANLYTVNDLVTAPDGTIYFVDNGWNRVRKITPNGYVYTVAGTGVRGDSGDGGPAVEAELNHPRAIALGRDGTLYIADSGNHRVRQVTNDGIIKPFAGTGEWGNSGGNGGPAERATFEWITDVAVASDGSVWIADHTGSQLRRVGPNGVINRVSGDGDVCESEDLEFRFGDPAANNCHLAPKQIAIGAGGAVYVTEDDDIMQIDSAGRMTGYAGNWNESLVDYPVQHRFHSISDMTVGPHGGLFVADRYDHRVIKIVDDHLTVLAGRGEPGFSGDGNKAVKARLNEPRAVASNVAGEIFVSDEENDVIRRISGPGLFYTEKGISVPSRNGQLIFEFSRAGLHQATVRANTSKVVRQFTYDSKGNLLESLDGYGKKTRFVRNANSALQRIVAPGGQTTEISVVDGDLLAIRAPDTMAWTMNYDSDSLLTKIAKPGGEVVEFEYYTNGRLRRDKSNTGNGWDIFIADAPNAVRTEMETSEGRRYIFETKSTDGGGRLYETKKPNGGVVTRNHFAIGDYDLNLPVGAKHRVRQSKHPIFGWASPVKSLIETTQPSGKTKHERQVVKAELAEPGDPSSVSRIKRQVTVNDRTSTYIFDRESRKFTFDSAEGRSSYTIENGFGDVIESRVSGLMPKFYQYDDRGRVVRIAQGYSFNERPVTYNYSEQGGAKGYLKSFTDPLGRLTAYVRDSRGRVLKKKLPGRRSVNYKYTDHGLVGEVHTPEENVYQAKYSKDGLIKAFIEPSVSGENFQTQFEYDISDKVTNIIKPSGRGIAYKYDEAGRIDSVATPSGMYNYEYVASTNQIARITAPDNVQVRREYDGELLKSREWSGGFGEHKVGFSYDNNFWQTGVTVNGDQIKRSYDDDGFLIQAGSQTIGRHPSNGLPVSSSLGSVSTRFSFNGFGEMELIRVTENYNLLRHIQFTRDSGGRIKSKLVVDNGEYVTYEYSYNDAGALTKVLKDGKLIEKYSYDVEGNRTAATVGGKTVSAKYDDQNRLVKYGQASFKYNKDGHLKSKVTDKGATKYEYDVLGNLRAVELPSGKRVRYLVDGMKRRVAKFVDGELEAGYIYKDARAPIAKIGNDGKVTARFVYSNRLNTPDYMIKGGERYRIISDQVGSPIMVIHSVTGEVVQEIEYDSFGRVISDTNPGFQPFGFAGGLIDRDTGLLRFGSRDYDPKTGRWTAKDPSGFAGGTTNFYEYSHNDPVNYLDPDGEFPITTAIVVGLAVKAAVGAISSYVGTRAVGGNHDAGMRNAALGAAIGLATPSGVSAGAGAVANTARSMGVNAASGATANAAGQAIEIYLDDCITLGDLNYGSIAGSAVGGAVGARANLPYASAGRAAQNAVAGNSAATRAAYEATGAPRATIFSYGGGAAGAYIDGGG